MFKFERNDIVGQVQITHQTDESRDGTDAAVSVDQRVLFASEIEIVLLDSDGNPGRLAVHLASRDRAKKGDFRCVG